MANVKLSAIASGGAVAGATDQIVTVRSGTTDVLTTPVALDTAQTWAAAQTFTNSDIKLLGSSTGVTTFTSANASATNYTITLPAANVTLKGYQAPTAVGASATAVIGGIYLLNTASGSVLTLPAATGTGGTILVSTTVSTTSGAHKVLANSTSDYLIGTATGQNANTPKMFQSPLATNHALQMPFSGSQPSGGIVGDMFEFVDVGANLWQVRGTYSAGTTPTTPFSATNT